MPSIVRTVRVVARSLTEVVKEIAFFVISAVGLWALLKWAITNAQ